MNKRIFIVFVAALALLSAGSALAKEKKAKGKSKADAAMEAKMAECMKHATPGEGHKVLDSLVGSWNHTVRWWMSPSAKPEESQGTSVVSWMLGGRFLRQDAKGQAMGQPFEGVGITGFDNYKGVYESIWIDSMSTSMMRATGQYDAAAKTFSEKGVMTDPMSGVKEKPFSAKWTLTDNDNYTYEMMTAGPDGQEFKCMEIIYTRAK